MVTATDTGAKRRKPWTQSELALLKKYYGCRNNGTLALYTGHSANSVEIKARKLGLKKPHTGRTKTAWEPWRLEHIREHFADTNTKVLAERLGVSVAMVNIMARSLGLGKASRNARYTARAKDGTLSLTPEGEAYLRKHFPTTRNSELMSAMKISCGPFSRLVRQLGLKKSREHISRCAKDSILATRDKYRGQGCLLDNNALPNAEKHQFKKGHPHVGKHDPETQGRS